LPTSQFILGSLQGCKPLPTRVGCLQVRVLGSVSLRHRSHPALRDAEAFATPDGLVPFKRVIVRPPRPARSLPGTRIPWGRGQGWGAPALQPPCVASRIPQDPAEMHGRSRDLLGTVCEWEPRRAGLAGASPLQRDKAVTPPGHRTSAPGEATSVSQTEHPTPHRWWASKRIKWLAGGTGMGQHPCTCSKVLLMVLRCQGWDGAAPAGKLYPQVPRQGQPGDSPHHHPWAKYPASLCPGGKCFVTCGSRPAQNFFLSQGMKIQHPLQHPSPQPSSLNNFSFLFLPWRHPNKSRVPVWVRLKR